MKITFSNTLILSLLLFISCPVSYANNKDNINAKGFHRAIAKFQKEPKVAVVVGINTYHSNSGLQPLKYAARDANLIRNSLKRQGYGVSLLTNQDAVKSHILRAIQSAGSTIRLRNTGTLVFVYSGHGFSHQKRNFLAPFGTVSNNLAKTGLSLDDVILAIKKTGVRRAILFIDACRNKPTMQGARSIATPSFIYKRSEGVKILYSTKFGGVSYESDKLRQGIFSHFLAQALNGVRTDQNGKITFNTVKSHVEENVALWIHRNQMPEQLPFESGNSHGVFILGNRGRIQPPTKPSQAVNHQSRKNQQRHVVRPPISRPRVYGQYKDNGNGTITDTRSKLMWKKCSEGQTGNYCSGKAKTYTWDNAKRTFNNVRFAGYSDWRLPTKSELTTLVFCSNKIKQETAIASTCADRNNPQNRYQKPTINQRLFPNTEGSPLSSSPAPYAHLSANTWGVSFLSGQEVRIRRGDKMHVRLVHRMQ